MLAADSSEAVTSEDEDAEYEEQNESDVELSDAEARPAAKGPARTSSGGGRTASGGAGRASSRGPARTGSGAAWTLSGRQAYPRWASTAGSALRGSEDHSAGQPNALAQRASPNRLSRGWLLAYRLTQTMYGSTFCSLLETPAMWAADKSLHTLGLPCGLLAMLLGHFCLTFTIPILQPQPRSTGQRVSAASGARATCRTGTAACW